MPDQTPKAAPATFVRDDDFEELYANNVRFESTVLDLKMIFGKSDQHSGSEVVRQHTAVTLPWPLVKTVAYYLAVNILVHETQNGPITVPPIHTPPPIEPPTEQQRAEILNPDELFQRLTDLRKRFLSEELF